MIRDGVKFADFKGIVRSVSTPASNTFEDLINLRTDRLSGGLKNRGGLRTVSRLPFSPDAIVFNKFIDHETFVAVGGRAIWVNPAIDVNGVHNELRNITDTFYGTLDENSIGDTFVTQENFPTYLTYYIVYNKTKGEYAVVTSQTTETNFKVNRNISWSDEDEIAFFPNDLLTYGEPDLNVIRPDADLGLTNWTPTPIFSRINDKENPDEVISPPLRNLFDTERIDPDNDEENVDWSIVGESTIWEALGTGDDPDDATYISTSEQFALFGVKLSDPSGYDNTKPISIVMRIRLLQNISTNIVLVVNVLEGTSYSTAALKHAVQIPKPAFDTWINATIQVPVGVIVNPNNLFIKFYYYSVVPTTGEIFRISHLKTLIPQVTPVQEESFRVRLSDLGAGIAKPDGLTRIRFFARSTFFSGAHLTVRFLKRTTGLVIAQEDFTISEIGSEYGFDIATGFIFEFTNFSNVALEFSARFTFAETQIAIQWAEVYVDSLVPVGSHLNYDVVGYPKFHQIDNFNSLYLDGIRERVSKSALWIGRIGKQLSPRKFFGTSGFEFSGIYVTSNSEDFSRGAFKDTDTHIQVKTEDARRFTGEVLNPNLTTGTDWVVGGTAVTLLEGIQTTGDGKYIASTLVDDTILIDFTSPSIFQIVGSVRFTIVVPAGFAGGSTLKVVLAEGGVEKATKYFVVSADSVIVAAFDTNLVINLANLQVKLVNYLGGEIRVDRVAATILLRGASPIEIPTDGGTYALNFSLLQDNFNESRLIYRENYGESEENPPSYKDANQLDLTVIGKIILAKISVRNGELINRRITAIKLYGGRIRSSGTVWRYLATIPIDSSSWVYSNGVYSIEVIVGNEIEIGTPYDELHNVAPFYTPVLSTVGFTRPENRSFAVPVDDKRTVVFSPVSASNGSMSSVLASGNFAQFVSTPGDIVALESVNRKILVFKKNSLLAVPIEGFTSVLRPETISAEIGLASPAGIAVADKRLIFFPSPTGIYATDGFKIVLYNSEWLDDYRNYSDSQISTSVGFYDAYSDSYYWFVRTGVDTADLWAFDLKYSNWRKESFLYDYDATYKFGMIKYVTKRADNRIVILDDVVRTNQDFLQMYEFPRSDLKPTDLIDTPIGKREISVRCSFRTNPYDLRSVDDAIYVDKGYIKSEDVRATATTNPDAYGTFRSTAVAFKVFDGNSLIRSANTLFGRAWFPLLVRKSLSRFSVEMSFRAASEILIREFGLEFKVTKKSGSVKQLL